MALEVQGIRFVIDPGPAKAGAAAIKRAIKSIGEESDKKTKKVKKNETEEAKKAKQLAKEKAAAVKKANREAEASFRSLRRAALRFAVAYGGIKLGTGIVKTTANYEQLRARLFAVTKSAYGASKAFGEIRKFALDAPFEVEQLTRAYIELRAVGIEPTREVMESMGNTAAAMGRDIQDYARAIVGALTNEMERLKRFGIVANLVGDRISGSIVFQYGEDGQKVTKTVARNRPDQILEFLTNLGNERFSGAMDRQMQTLVGQFSLLQDAAKDTAFKLGKELSGSIQDLIKAVTQAIKDLGNSGIPSGLGRLIDFWNNPPVNNDLLRKNDALAEKAAFNREVASIQALTNHELFNRIGEKLQNFERVSDAEFHVLTEGLKMRGPKQVKRPMSDFPNGLSDMRRLGQFKDDPQDVAFLKRQRKEVIFGWMESLQKELRRGGFRSEIQGPPKLGDEAPFLDNRFPEKGPPKVPQHVMETFDARRKENERLFLMRMDEDMKKAEASANQFRVALDEVGASIEKNFRQDLVFGLSNAMQTSFADGLNAITDFSGQSELTMRQWAKNMIDSIRQVINQMLALLIVKKLAGLASSFFAPATETAGPDALGGTGSGFQSLGGSYDSGLGSLTDLPANSRGGSFIVDGPMSGFKAFGGNLHGKERVDVTPIGVGGAGNGGGEAVININTTVIADDAKSFDKKWEENFNQRERQIADSIARRANKDPNYRRAFAQS